MRAVHCAPVCEAVTAACIAALAAVQGFAGFDQQQFLDYDALQLSLPGLIAALVAAVGAQAFTAAVFPELPACGVDTVGCFRFIRTLGLHCTNGICFAELRS